MKRVAQATNPEITKVFMPAREAIEHGKDIIYPIRSGEISGFNAKKGFGFIRPDDKMNPIFMKDPERIFKQ